MNRTFTFLSRIQFAAIRRVPLDIQSAYILGLGQVIELPKYASSTFGQIFSDRLYRLLAPLPPHSTVVDLGTNLGIFCMYINQIVSSARIYCFEANPNLFPFLQKNIQRLPDRDNEVKLFNMAVAGVDGFVDFTLDHLNPANVASTAFLDISSFPDAGNFRTVRVPCVRLDSIVSERIDFLKCDIEGAEYAVLGEGLLTPKRVSQAVIEFHDIKNRAKHFNDIIDAAFENGFSVYLADLDEESSPAAIIDSAASSAYTSMVVRFCARDVISS